MDYNLSETQSLKEALLLKLPEPLTTTPGKIPTHKTHVSNVTKPLSRVITGLLQDDMELFKQFMDSDSFRHWLQQTVFNLTYTNDEAA